MSDTSTERTQPDGPAPGQPATGEPTPEDQAPDGSAPPAGTDRATPRSMLQTLPAYAPALLIALGGWSHRWNNEDAFINFRVVDNLFAGHGPVFNAGERIEAGTSPLWIAVLSIGRALFGWFLAIEWIAVLLGLAIAVGAFALAGRAALVAAQGRGEGAVLPVGPLVVSSVAVVWDFATSGLEMSLVWLWIAACWYVLCRAARGGRPTGWRRLAAVATIGLAPLIRPDLGAMMVCVAVGWFVLVRPRRVASDLGAMLALPVAYQVFRMGYFASLVPSTALAKDASGIHLRQGWDYLLDFLRPYGLWLPLAVVVVTIVVRLRVDHDRRQAVATAAIVAAALLHATYIVAVGGDYMHGRLLLPAFFALCLPAWVVVRARALPALAAGAVATVWAIVAVVALRPPEPLPGGLHQIADWRQLMGAPVVPEDVELWTTGIRNRDLYDEGVRGYFPILAVEPAPGRDPEALVVTLGSIGIPAYQLGTDVWVIDIGGLAEPLAARTDIVPGRPAGHRKQVDPAWYDARFGVVGDDPDAQAAEEALACAPIDDLLDAVSEDMTPGRFLSNLWNSPSYTRLHIPADPHEALAEHC